MSRKRCVCFAYECYEKTRSNLIMKKLYVLTSGCYSDYGIEGIFTSKEKAFAYIGLTTEEQMAEIDEGMCGYRIEEWDLDPEPTESKYIISVTIDEQGSMGKHHDRVYGSVYSGDGLEYAKDHPLDETDYTTRQTK